MKLITAVVVLTLSSSTAITQELDLDSKKALYVTSVSMGLMAGFSVACGFTSISNAETVLAIVMTRRGLPHHEAHRAAIGQARITANQYRNGGAPCDASIRANWRAWENEVTLESSRP